MLWIVDGNSGNDRVIRVDLAAGGAECIAWAQAPTSSLDMRAITADAAHAEVWFTARPIPAGPFLLRLDRNTGTVTDFLPAHTFLADPRAMAFGPSDGKLYVLDQTTSGTQIKRIDVVAGTLTVVFAFPLGMVNPAAIAVSPGGLIYAMDRTSAGSYIFKVDLVAGTSTQIATSTGGRDLAYVVIGSAPYVASLEDTGSATPVIRLFDPGTGAAGTLGTISLGVDPTTFTFAPGVFYVADHAANGGLGAVLMLAPGGPSDSVVSSPVIFTDARDMTFK